MSVSFVRSLVRFSPLFLRQQYTPHQLYGGQWYRETHFCHSEMGRCQKGRLFSSSSSPFLPPSLLWLIKKCVSFLPSHCVTSAVSVCEKVALATPESSAEKLQILFPLKNKKKTLWPYTYTHTPTKTQLGFYSVCTSLLCCNIPSLHPFKASEWKEKNKRMEFKRKLKGGTRRW
jgi:hypothetical protein